MEKVKKTKQAVVQAEKTELEKAQEIIAAQREFDFKNFQKEYNAMCEELSKKYGFAIQPQLGIVPTR